MPDILPDCRLSGEPKGVVRLLFQGRMTNFEWVYCGNCGKKGCLVPCENMTFAFWLCPQCEKYGDIAGMMSIPDEVFWQKVHEASLESYGKDLNAQEQAMELQNPDSVLSKLAKDRP